jgi:hypothetical protein
MEVEATRFLILPHGARASARRRQIQRPNRIERFFNKLKHFRAVATRYDKNLENYLAPVKLASARIWMRFNKSMA